MTTEDNLYTIDRLETDEGFSGRVSFNTGHPVLQGHFPGYPVVPGAWLIRIIHDITQQVTGKILVLGHASQVKFLAAFLPTAETVLFFTGQVDTTEPGSFKVTASFNGENRVYMKFKGTFREV